MPPYKGFVGARASDGPGNIKGAGIFALVGWTGAALGTCGDTGIMVFDWAVTGATESWRVDPEKFTDL
jgi:hypothetical protein